ncbi:MAG: regulator [Clostridia bacterium]|nr:regulator [Clostridia bacterium]
MKRVSTDQAPAAVGPYSQAIAAGGYVYTSGQLGIDLSGRLAEGLEGQTRRAIENLSAVLLAAGSSLSSVVKTTCYLSNINDFTRFNEIYAEYFTEKPARTLIEAAALPKGAILEIDAVAEIAKEQGE